ncbi:hypothetical protein SBC1_38590 (plasmid) [Caballeronia sp. SBC1]|nr:hypothetical protein SBC1_38590 [Caballeronia sp. SBC1]
MKSRGALGGHYAFEHLKPKRARRDTLRRLQYSGMHASQRRIVLRRIVTSRSDACRLRLGASSLTW